MGIFELCNKVGAVLRCGKFFTSYEVSEVTTDSRRCKVGSIFAPILGYRCNGADFIYDAYERGCRIFISETDGEFYEDCAVIMSENIRKTTAELAKILSGFNADKVKIIGVTGTKGKTGIVYTAAALLCGAGVKACSVGTLGVVDGSGELIEKTVNTTPESTELYRILAQAESRGAEVVCLEVSSQAIKDYRIYGIDFFAVVFSSLGVDHISPAEHCDFTDYICTKRKLFTDYKSLYKIFNADDKYTSFFTFGTEKCIKCGFSDSSDYRIKKFKNGIFGSSFELNGIPFTTRFIASYEILNASIALVCASLAASLPLCSFAETLSAVSVPGRFERYLINGRHFIIDYAHNKQSFEGVLTTAGSLFHTRLITVFGSVGERSYQRRRDLAQIAEKYSYRVIITCDDPGFEDCEGICREISSNFKDRSKYKIVLDRELAIYEAYRTSRVGDVILLLGKGHEQTMNISGKSIPFSEKDVLRNIECYG